MALMLGIHDSQHLVTDQPSQPSDPQDAWMVFAKYITMFCSICRTYLMIRKKELVENTATSYKSPKVEKMGNTYVVLLDRIDRNSPGFTEISAP